jgi:protein-tyrosine phosphatase
MSARPTPPPTPRERHIRLAGTRNLRDVGGYPASGGRQTRWATLYRSDALDQLPPASQEALLALGVRQAIDLRWPTEVEARPSAFGDAAAMRYVNLPFRDTGESLFEGFPSAYRGMLDDRGSQIAAVARALLAPDGVPAIIGCAAGIDRTGVVVAVLLAAVGVPIDVVAADYALSATSYANDTGDSGLDDWRSGPIAIDCRPEYIVAALEYLQRGHGGAAAYLVANGLTDADIARLRELLTEPTADALP